MHKERGHVDANMGAGGRQRASEQRTTTLNRYTGAPRGGVALCEQGRTDSSGVMGDHRTAGEVFSSAAESAREVAGDAFLNHERWCGNS